jgi:ankyrin repeat protein
MEDQYGITPLSYACWTYNIDLIDTLILNGAAINYPDNEGNTPLIYAIELGDYDIIELLLLGGANVNHVTEDFNNALTEACRHENTNIVALLVDFGANINFPGSPGNDNIWSPLMNACNYNNLDTVQFLIDLGVNIYYTVHNMDQESCENAVIIAVKNNNLELLDILINAGIDFNNIIAEYNDEDIFGDYGYTSVLEYCCRYDDNHLEMVQYVIYRMKLEGITINTVDRYNETPLFSAVAEENNINILNFIIHCGINVNHVNENGDTALTHLFRFSKINVEKIYFLIKHGSNINHENNNGNTALIYAAQRNLIDIVREILKFKPNIYHKNKEGKTALDYATLFMHNEIKNLLLF